MALLMPLKHTEAIVKLFDYVVANYSDCVFQKDTEVNDYRTRDRSWKQRLFSRPWRPFQSTERVYEPIALVFIEEKLVFVSPKTYNLFIQIAENDGKSNS